MAQNQAIRTIESMKKDMKEIVNRLEDRISMLDLIRSTIVDHFKIVNQTCKSSQCIPKDVLFQKMIFIRDIESLLNKYNVMLHGSNVMVGAKPLRNLLDKSRPFQNLEQELNDRDEFLELFASQEPLYASIRARYRPLLDSLVVVTEQPNANNVNGNEKVSRVQFDPSTKPEGGRRRTRRSRSRRSRSRRTKR